MIIINHCGFMCLTTECPIPPSCDHWLDVGVNESGVYPINPDGGTPFQVSIKES